jgi:uncharacterized iron-regulated protein
MGVHPDGPPPDTSGVHYRIYRPSGESISFETLISEIDPADVVFVGEEHDDPIGHFLQARLFQGLHERRVAAGNGRAVALSLEMFTTDVQSIVDEYLQGLISERSFRSSSNPWQNYETDYRPSVEYAKENGLAVIAANAPRRYASRVTSNGPESLLDLSENARQWLAPLPYAQASEPYIAQWNETMRENSHGTDDDSDADMPIDDTVAMYPNMLAAQSLWDATMAYSIAKGLLRDPGSSVIHFVGAFHVENRTGIPEHLLRYRPGTKICIISMRSKESLNMFEKESDAALGDYIIVTDGNLPRSHDRTF